MGVTRAEFIKLVEQGKVASDVFIPKFIDAMNKATKSGLPGALQSTFVAVGRLKNAFQSFIDVLFRAGLDELFQSILGLVTNLFIIAKPFVALFGGLLFGLLKVIVGTLEIITAVIADAVQYADQFVESVTGSSLTQYLSWIGQAFGWIIGMLKGGFIGPLTNFVKSSKLLKYFEAVGGVVRWIVDSISKLIGIIPGLGMTAKAAAPVARGMSKLGKRMNAESVDRAIKVGAGVQALGKAQTEVSIRMKGDADSMFKASVDNNTSGRLDSDTRE